MVGLETMILIHIEIYGAFGYTQSGFLLPFYYPIPCPLPWIKLETLELGVSGSNCVCIPLGMQFKWEVSVVAVHVGLDSHFLSVWSYGKEKLKIPFFFLHNRVYLFCSDENAG